MKEFWIDFNVASKYISFYTEDPSMEGDRMWESVYIKEEEVIVWSLESKYCITTVYASAPTCTCIFSLIICSTLGF